MGLHPATLSVLVLIAMSRLASISAFAAREVQHARELICSVQKLPVAVVSMHRASFQGWPT